MLGIRNYSFLEKKVQFVERQFRDKNDNKIATFYDIIYQVFVSNKKKGIKIQHNLKGHQILKNIFCSYVFMYLFCLNSTVSKLSLVSPSIAAVFSFNVVLALWILFTLFMYSIYACYSRNVFIFKNIGSKLLHMCQNAEWSILSYQTPCQLSIQNFIVKGETSFYLHTLYPSNGHIHILDYI